jgi:toxin ParE1/3/4
LRVDLERSSANRMQLEISKQAHRDIDSLYVYGLENFGEKTADEYVVGLLDLFDLLKINPRMAVEIPSLKRKTRMLRYRRHLAFYRIDLSRLIIVRIFHQRQNWSAHF